MQIGAAQRTQPARPAAQVGGSQGVWRSLPDRWPDLALWLAALLLYAATTARDVLPADAGEFQFVAARWGIAHPPGYPLYTMASALWARIVPLGTLPFRVNLLSAVVAATALLLCSLCVRRWARVLGLGSPSSRAGGAVAAIALGTAATFWAQATTANIRMPTALFTAWGYLALAGYQAAAGDAVQRTRSLVGLALATGLGIGHHPSLAFIAVGWGLFLMVVDPRLLLEPRRWLGPVAAMAAAWALPQLYLPLRGGMSGVPLAPESIDTVRGFWHHVLARGFGGDMFAFASLRDLVLRLQLLPSLLRMQFSPLMLAGMGIGLVEIARRDARIFLGLATSWVVMAFVTITYRAPQTIEYLMPAYVPMALALGIGASLLLDATRRRSRGRRRGARALAATMLALLLVRILPNVVDFSESAGDHTIREYVEPILTSAPDDALILADWRWATPLWVLQATEGLGAGSDIVYVVPESDADYDQAWQRRVAEARDRPLYTTHVYEWSDRSAIPVGGGFRLVPRPMASLPDGAGFAPLEADLGPVHLLGYRWRGDAAPGATLELQVAWRAVGSQTPEPNLATRIWGDESRLLSAADRALGTSAVEGEVQVSRLTHQLPATACAEAVTTEIGGYAVVDGAFRDLGSAVLPPLAVDCAYPRLPTQHPWPGVVLPDGPVLRGIDFDVDAVRGVTTFLHWCGPGKPLEVRVGEDRHPMAELALGECQTTALVLSGSIRDLALAYADGGAATLVSLPLPQPAEDDRYVPYGSEMVLVGDEMKRHTSGPAAGTTVLTLAWLTGRPLTQDFAVSARLMAKDGTWLGIHDMQPGLGAIPTLKWMVRGRTIRDPHPVSDLASTVTQYGVVVYDRFRITPLRSTAGDGLTNQLR